MTSGFVGRWISSPAPSMLDSVREAHQDWVRKPAKTECDPHSWRQRGHTGDSQTLSSRDSIRESTEGGSEEGEWFDYEAPCPEEILTGLRTESDPERRRLLVLHAEEVHFSESQREELAPLLLDFIETNRESNNRHDAIAVASAIRRYVSVLNVENLGSVVSLLRPRDGVTASPDNQLEVLKMLARTYEVIPPMREDPEPDLAQEILNVAKAHLNHYVFEGEMHAAIALQACLSLAGMASPRAQEVYRLVNALPFAWFRRLVKQETERLENVWETKAGPNVLNLMKDLLEILETDQPAEANLALPSA